MEKMLVVVFDSEPMAHKGEDAFKQLDREGTISVYAAATIKKDSDGKVTVLKANDEFPVRTVGGTAIGSLIGLLGGPIGVLVGAASGTLVGALDDLYVSGVNAQFVEDASRKLAPGKYGVVADISEEYVIPLDTKMTELGGQVFRTAKGYVEIDQMESDVAALDAEIDQLNNEMKSARTEHKAKLQAKIEKLKEKRQKKIEQAKQRLEQSKKEHETKVQALKEKSAHAHGEMKAAIDARVTKINEDYQKTLKKWKNWEAERLERKADRLEEKARKLKS